MAVPWLLVWEREENREEDERSQAVERSGGIGVLPAPKDPFISTGQKGSVRERNEEEERRAEVDAARCMANFGAKSHDRASVDHHLSRDSKGMRAQPRRAA